MLPRNELDFGLTDHRGTPRRIRRAHLVGISGAGMRSLCDVMLGWGWQLSGSDLVVDARQPWTDARVRVHQGHAASQVPSGTDLVVYSDAIPPENPELRRAVQLGIPTLSYFEMLGALMNARDGVAVAGTHGKSTTTAMLAQMLIDARLDPAVVYGAVPIGGYSGGHPGHGELMLVEACEYRANFLHLRPQVAAILGIEPDHFDCFESREHLAEAFARFAASLPTDGLLLIPKGCPVTEQATAGASCRRETFGLTPAADWSARAMTSRKGLYGFELVQDGRRLVNVELRIPGKHNVGNALAAAALAWHHGLEPEEIAGALGRFRGLRRRLEKVGSWRGVALVDDFAHHPTEVAASLAAVRQMYPERRLWAIFQPHQVSRTSHLLDELAASLQNADKVAVAKIFRARDPEPHPGEVTAADLARRIRAGGPDVLAVHETERIIRLLKTDLRPGDVLLTMGAGGIRKIHDGIIDRLREDRAAG